MIAISLKVPRRMFDEILRYSEMDGMNVSEFIRRAIDRYISMLRNRESYVFIEGGPVRVRAVSITISRRPVKAKKRKKIIKIRPSETMIRRELPPPKLRFVKITIGGENGGA